MLMTSARRLFQNFKVLLCPPTACSLPARIEEFGTSFLVAAAGKLHPFRVHLNRL